MIAFLLLLLFSLLLFMRVANVPSKSVYCNLKDVGLYLCDVSLNI
jgi:hypothetical protein